MWQRRTYVQLNDFVKGYNIIKFIVAHRVKLVGHIESMDILRKAS